MLEPDGGEMLWQGRSVRFRSPAEAASQGIAMVHQESMLAPHLSVAENIFLGREPRLPLGWVNRREMIQRAQRIIEEHRFPLQAALARGKTQPGRQADGGDLPRHSAGIQPADIRRAHFFALGAETQEVFRIVSALRARNVGRDLYHASTGGVAHDRRPRHRPARRRNSPFRPARRDFHQ